MMSDDYSWVFGNDQLESEQQIDSRAIIRTNRRRMLMVERQHNLADILPLPASGETIHMLSNGMYDFFTIAALLIDMLDGYTEHLYASTWTISQQTIIDLFDTVDSGKIGRLHILSDRSFKRRKPASYAQLIAGLRKRNMRFVANHNHSKVSLLNHGDNYITIEGSASFTTTPRLEQHTISNDKELWQWHRQWMSELLDNAK